MAINSTPLKVENRARTVFISYSHHDRRWVNDIKRFLAPVVRSGSVSLWDDAMILAGSQWRVKIDEELNGADAAILVVSPHFLASSFIAENELPPLLEAAKTRGLQVFWLLVSSCLFEETSLTSYQATHDVSHPLDKLSVPKRHEALTNIAKLIRSGMK